MREIERDGVGESERSSLRKPRSERGRGWRGNYRKRRADPFPFVYREPVGHSSWKKMLSDRDTWREGERDREKANEEIVKSFVFWVSLLLVSFEYDNLERSTQAINSFSWSDAREGCEMDNSQSDAEGPQPVQHAGLRGSSETSWILLLWQHGRARSLAKDANFVHLFSKSLFSHF